MLLTFVYWYLLFKLIPTTNNQLQRSRQFIYDFIQQLIDGALNGLRICHTNNRGLGLMMKNDQLSSESECGFVFFKKVIKKNFSHIASFFHLLFRDCQIIIQLFICCWISQSTLDISIEIFFNICVGTKRVCNVDWFNFTRQLWSAKQIGIYWW